MEDLTEPGEFEAVSGRISHMVMPTRGRAAVDWLAGDGFPHIS